MTRQKENGQTIQERLRAMSGGISAPQLAKILGLARVTIYKRAAAGDIPCLRLSGTIRFDPEMVARWLDHQEIAR